MKKAWILQSENNVGEVFTIIEYKEGNIECWSSLRGNITEEIEQIDTSKPLEFHVHFKSV